MYYVSTIALAGFTKWVTINSASVLKTWIYLYLFWSWPFVTKHEQLKNLEFLTFCKKKSLIKAKYLW